MDANGGLRMDELACVLWNGICRIPLKKKDCKSKNLYEFIGSDEYSTEKLSGLVYNLLVMKMDLMTPLIVLIVEDKCSVASEENKKTKKKGNKNA